MSNYFDKFGLPGPVEPTTHSFEFKDAGFTLAVWHKDNYITFGDTTEPRYYLPDLVKALQAFAESLNVKA